MKLPTLAALAFVAACGSKSEVGATSSAGSSASAAAPEAPPREASLFPAKKPLLDGLEALALVPREADVVVFAKSLDALEGALGTGTADSRIREAILDELDDDALAFSKDLGEVSAWKKLGVDPTKPVGYVVLDGPTRIEAMVLPLANEAAWKAFLKTRKSNRKLREENGVTILAAKEDVTRAVVVRDGHAIVIRAGAAYESANGDGVAAAVDRLAKLAPDASLAANTRAMEAVRAVAFGETIGGYVDASFLTAEEQARVAYERFRRLRDAKTDAGGSKVLDERHDAAVAGAKKLDGTFVVFGADVVGGELLAKGRLVPAAGGPAWLGSGRALPPAFAALRTSSLEGWGKIEPSLLPFVVGRTATFDARWRRVHDLVADADLTGDVAYLTRDAIALGLVDPTSVEKKLASMGEGWTHDAASGVSTYGGHRFRVADGYLVVASDEGFVKAFPAANPGAAAPPAPTGIAAELANLSGTSALFRFRPYAPSPLGAELVFNQTTLDGPCGFAMMVGVVGGSKEQMEARSKACKKLNEIDAAVAKRRSAARSSLVKVAGTVELVAKPSSEGTMIYGALASEAGSFDALLKTALGAFAEGAPTADEAKQRKALLAEIEAIDEEASKHLGEQFGLFSDALQGDNVLGARGGMGLGDMGGLGGLGLPPGPGLGHVGTGRGDVSGLGGLGTKPTPSGGATKPKP